jgi:serine phosphatase RsbU (regulator of sigma subunit)
MILKIMERITLLAKFGRPERTVAGDLGFGLSVLVTVAFLLLGTVNFIYSYNNDLQNLDTKASELTQSATEVLASPVWNIDDREIQRIIGVFLQSDIITSAKLVDERGQVMLERWKTRESPRITLTKPVERNGAVIGQLTLQFTDAAIRDKQAGTIAFLGVALALAITAVNVGTRGLMRKYLRDPLDRLIRGLDVIAGGDYRFQLPDATQEEVHRINKSVNSMARELSARETALQDNRQRLEVLNTAIMEIFSGHDTQSLIDQALRSTMRLTKAHAAAFLPTDDPTETPRPRLMNHGQMVDLQPALAVMAIEENFAKLPKSCVHRFQLKSRHRHIGDFLLGFDAPLEPQVHALLKSLTSLATVAMIRQSFIRESAFMTAELKVAESVQRATLPGQKFSSLLADVGFHYEPVLRVGGDWTNIIEHTDEGSIYALMGDVTGHGIAQSMITAAVSGALESLQGLMAMGGSSAAQEPSDILQLISRIVDKVGGDTNMQMTCVAVKLDFRNHKVTVANAGHQFPVLLEPVKSGQLKARALTGGLLPILGMNLAFSGRKPLTVKNAVFPFPAGSRLVLFTDGLVDGRSGAGKTFHRQFIRQLSKIEPGTNSAMITSEIVSGFRKHTTGGSIKDDVCLVVIGSTASTKPTEPTAPAGPS